MFFVSLLLQDIMVSSIIARCCYLDNMACIEIFEDSSLDFICNELCIRFTNLRSGSFSLRYSFGDECRFMLVCDNDVCCMLRSQLIVKANFIWIYVIDSLPFPCNTCRERVDCSNRIFEGVDCSNTSSERVDSGDTNTQRLESLSSGTANDFNSCIENDFYLGGVEPSKSKVYLSNDWKTYISHEQQCFEGGVVEFRDKLRKYAVEVGFKYVYLKNDKTRVTAECSKKTTENCMWRIHASLSTINGYFYIRAMNNEHTCRGVFRSPSAKMIASKLVSTLVADDLRDNPLLRPIDVVRDMKKNYGLDIAYQHAWRAKEMAAVDIHGDEKVSYALMNNYRDLLLQYNPGSHCILDVEHESKKFKRIFVMFRGCIYGFQYCRPVLFLDGAFLKSRYRGTILSATARNGNNGK